MRKGPEQPVGGNPEPQRMGVSAIADAIQRKFVESYAAVIPTALPNPSFPIRRLFQSPEDQSLHDQYRALREQGKALSGFELNMYAMLTSFMPAREQQEEIAGLVAEKIAGDFLENNPLLFPGMAQLIHGEKGTLLEQRNGIIIATLTTLSEMESVSAIRKITDGLVLSPDDATALFTQPHISSLMGKEGTREEFSPQQVQVLTQVMQQMQANLAREQQFAPPPTAIIQPFLDTQSLLLSHAKELAISFPLEAVEYFFLSEVTAIADTANGIERANGHTESEEWVQLFMERTLHAAAKKHHVENPELVIGPAEAAIHDWELTGALDVLRNYQGPGPAAVRTAFREGLAKIYDARATHPDVLYVLLAKTMTSQLYLQTLQPPVSADFLQTTREQLMTYAKNSNLRPQFDAALQGTDLGLATQNPTDYWQILTAIVEGKQLPEVPTEEPEAALQAKEERVKLELATTFPAIAPLTGENPIKFAEKLGAHGTGLMTGWITEGKEKRLVVILNPHLDEQSLESTGSVAVMQYLAERVITGAATAGFYKEGGLHKVPDNILNPILSMVSKQVGNIRKAVDIPLNPVIAVPAKAIQAEVLTGVMSEAEQLFVTNVQLEMQHVCNELFAELQEKLQKPAESITYDDIATFVTDSFDNPQAITALAARLQDAGNAVLKEAQVPFEHGPFSLPASVSVLRPFTTLGEMEYKLHPLQTPDAETAPIGTLENIMKQRFGERWLGKPEAQMALVRILAEVPKNPAIVDNPGQLAAMIGDISEIEATLTEWGVRSLF